MMEVVVKEGAGGWSSRRDERPEVCRLRIIIIFWWILLHIDTNQP